MRFGRGVQLWLGGPLILAFGALIGALVVAIGGKGMLVKMAGPAAALLIAWALGIFVFSSTGGAGAIEPGDVAAILGTTCPLQAVVDRPTLDPRANLWAGCHVVPGRWVIEANVGSTGDG